MNRMVIQVVAEGTQIWLMNSTIQINPVNCHAFHHCSLHDCFVADSNNKLPSFSTSLPSYFTTQRREG